MTKIAIINDQHFGVRNDAISIHKYFEKFYSQVFFPTLEEQGIKDIFILGDLVHRRKYINFVTLNEMKRQFIDPIEAGNYNVKMLLGNHDCYYRNSNDINGPDQLINSSNIHLIEHTPEEYTFDNTTFSFCPWITKDNYDICVDGISNSNADILLGHFDIKGFEMYRGAVSEHGFEASMFKKFNYVFSGHYHHKSSVGNIHYLGAPYEMMWNDYNDPKGFHIFDTETQDLIFVKNQFTLFNKLVYNDSRISVDDVPAMDFSHIEDSYVKIVVQSKDNSYLFDLFVTKVEEFSPIDIQIIDENDYFEDMNDEEILNEAEDTLTILNNYVTSIPDLEENKGKKLKTTLREIYTEALDI